MRVASKHDIPEYEIIPNKLMWKETKFKLPEVSKYSFASCATMRTFVHTERWWSTIECEDF